MPYIDSECKERWIEELEAFKNIVYKDIYEPFGFTLQEAWQAWQMNLLKNAIYDLEAKVEGLDKDW